MKFLIVVAAILGASMAGEPDNRGKRGLVGSIGNAYDASLGLSSLHLPLASSVVAAPSISAISAPTVINSVHTAPILRSHLPLTTSVVSAPSLSVINSVQAAPILSQPQIVSYGSAHSLGLTPSLGLGSSLNLHSLALGSSISSIQSARLINSYRLGGLPLTSHVNNIHAW